MDYETLTNQSKHNAAIESEEMNLVALLRPRIFLDGNKWCVLYGENIMDGIAGFGDSPILAVYDFNKAWRREVPANTCSAATLSLIPQPNTGPADKNPE